MRRKFGLTWRRRYITAGLLLVGAIIFFVAGAFADASNPILGTIKAEIVSQTSTTITIGVKGQWNWQSHGSDCNFDRAATGAAIVWNDSTETGWTVSNGSTTVGVGVKTQRAGDTNPIDRMVHPADRGNLATTPTLDGPATQKYVDPVSTTPAAPSTTDATAWKGGCGREPLVLKGSPILVASASESGNTVTMTTASPHGIPVGVTDRSVQIFSMFNTGYNSPAADVDTNFVNATATSATTFTYTAAASGLPPCTTTTTCKGKFNQEPWGSWGYTTSGSGNPPATTNANAFQHTYLKSALPGSICVNFYDVHGGGTVASGKFQLVNGSKEITADLNGDNSVDTNDFDINNGANCVKLFGPKISTSATPSITIGSTISDSATLTGTAPNAGGTITFAAYKPSDPTCAGTPEFTSSTFAVNGDGTYGPATFTPGKVGDYHWIASYSGDNGTLTLPVSGKCGDTGETSTVGKAQPLLSTTAVATASLNTNPSVKIHDVANVTQPANTPNTTGAITFNVYGPGDTTCATSLATLNASPATNGTGAYTSDDFTATSPGTYRWIAHLAQDDNNKPANTSCNDSNESTLVINPLIDVKKTPASQSVPLNGIAHFTIVVKNIGDARLSNITVGDALAPGCARTAAQTSALSTAQNGHAYLDPNESFTYTCNSDPVTAPFTNVVTACGDDPIGGNVCDTDNNGGNPPPGCPASEADRCASVSVSDLTSKQDFRPKDTGTLSGLVNPNGNLTFRLFKGTTCAAGDELDLNGSGTPGNALTQAVSANGDYSVTAADFLSTMLGSTNTGGTYSWQLTYSGDTNNNADIVGACGTEHFVVTNS